MQSTTAALRQMSWPGTPAWPQPPITRFVAGADMRLSNASKIAAELGLSLKNYLYLLTHLSPGALIPAVGVIKLARKWEKWRFYPAHR